MDKKLKMTLRQIAVFRLQNQQITHPAFAEPKHVAAWLGAMQAQDYTHAKWAVGLRIPGSTDADVEKAIDQGDIIRTHILRPTWHRRQQPAGRPHHVLGRIGRHRMQRHF